MPLLPLLVGLAGVLILAPLIGAQVALLELPVVLLLCAAVLLFLINLWSPMAILYLLVFSMLLSPELLVGELPGAAEARGLTLRFDDYLILLVAIAWLARMAVSKELGLVRDAPLNVPILTYIGVCLAATTFGVMAGRVVPLTGFFYVAKYFEFTVVYFMVLNYVRSRRQAKRLLHAALLTAAIIGVIAILQIPTGQRVSAPFEGATTEPNTLGGYLVLMIAVGLALLSEMPRLSQKLLWTGLVVLLVVPLIYTLSRTSWAAFAAMLATMTLLSRRKALFVYMMAAILVLFMVSPPKPVVERIQYTVAGAPAGGLEIGGYALEPSAATRISWWITLGEELLAKPFLGHGVTGYGFIETQYPRTGIETGLLGLAALGWVLWRLFRSGRRLLAGAGEPFERAVGLGFLAGVAAMVVHGLGANTFVIVRIMEPFWLLAGLTTVLVAVRREESAAQGTPPTTTPRPQLAGQGGLAG